MFRAPDTEDTTAFYDKLIQGQLSRGFWGAESRFDPQKIAITQSVQEHYIPCLTRLCRGTEVALDIGCSTGGFTALLAKECAAVTGIDLSGSAVEVANQHFARAGLVNCWAQIADGGRLPFASGSFDLIQMVDVIHHAEDPVSLLKEVHRLLDHDGKVIVFEPNKYNVVLWLMCLLDSNEWGALRLGSKKKYHQLFSELFNVELMDYNGLLIGIDSLEATAVARWLSQPAQIRILRSQSPKIHAVLSKKA